MCARAEHRAHTPINLSQSGPTHAGTRAQLKCNHCIFFISADNAATSGARSQPSKSEGNINFTTVPRVQQSLSQPTSRKTSLECTKPSSRACIAGTQTMQHLVRNAQQIDPFPPCSTDSFILDSGNFSTDDSLNDSKLMGSGNHQFRMRFNRSMYEPRERPVFRSNDANPREQQATAPAWLFDGCEGDVLPDQVRSSRKFSHPTDFLTYRSNSFNLSNGNESPHNMSYNDILHYISTPAASTRQRQELEVLEENIANVSRYVDRLTDGGSGRNSRESSCVRGNDTSASNFLNNSKDAGMQRSGRADISTSTAETGMPRTMDSSLEESFRRNSLKSPQQMVDHVDQQHHFQPQDPNNASPQQLALINALLNQLNLNNSGTSGE